MEEIMLVNLTGKTVVIRSTRTNSFTEILPNGNTVTETYLPQKEERIGNLVVARVGRTALKGLPEPESGKSYKFYIVPQKYARLVSPGRTDVLWPLTVQATEQYISCYQLAGHQS